MTLENLLAIHKLQRFEASPEGVRRLLAAAERNLADANLAGLSAENRFDAAYKAILQCAMAGLWANGYRTATSQQGHHQTALQVLPKTMGVDQDVVIVLDALRKQRNLNDYEGDPVSDAVVAECIRQAAQLITLTRRWLQIHHANLQVCIRMQTKKPFDRRHRASVRPALTARRGEPMVANGGPLQAGASRVPPDGGASGTPPWGYPTAFHRHASRRMSAAALTRGSAHAGPVWLMRTTTLPIRAQCP